MIGVTVLTSDADADLAAVGIDEGAAARVERLARLVVDAGLDGVVCSAAECRALRAFAPPGFLLVTPGIRPADASADDQRRTVTPADALAAGSDHLVIGRPVTAAADPLASASRDPRRPRPPRPDDTRPMSEPKRFISPQQLMEDSLELGRQILESGFRPDYIVGVWRGGTPVGIMVQELLDFYGVHTDHISIRTSSYAGVDARVEAPVRVHGLSYLTKKLESEDSLLIVDDVFDTGLSVKAVIDRHRRALPQEHCRTTCASRRPTTSRRRTAPASSRTTPCTPPTSGSCSRTRWRGSRARRWRRTSRTCCP